MEILKLDFYRSLNEMHFIGIFANHKEYENIKKNVIKILKRDDIKLININSTNISNVRNIVFETVVFCDEIKFSSKYENIVNNLCVKCKYVIVNADVSNKFELLSNKFINCITYGLNQKSTITISSVMNDKVIVDIQRNMRNISNQNIEMKEISVDLKKHKYIKIQNILAVYAIYCIYNEIQEKIRKKEIKLQKYYKNITKTLLI